MSIVCQKCRRLVRGNNIFINNAEYYCPKCKVHYKLSKSYIDDYFHRYESPIDSEIIIDKSGESFIINIPNGSESHNSIAVLFSAVLLLVFSGYLYFLASSFTFVFILFLLSILHFVLFFYSYYGSVILTLDKEEIVIKRTFYKISHTKKKSLRKLKSIFEFKVANSIDGIKLDFGNPFNGIGFGLDLKESEKQWLVKELRYMHKQLSAKK